MKPVLSMFLSVFLTLHASASTAATSSLAYDVLIRGGTIYDGSGGKPFIGDVGIKKDRIAYIGPNATGRAAVVIDARGKAVSAGFINMLAHPEETLMTDGRALSDLTQGVTLEVLGEDSMGPLTPTMRNLMKQRQGDIKYEIAWTTLGGYLSGLEKRGISPNVASFVGAETVRTNVLGENDVAPTQAWTPVAQFAEQSIDAINYGPGATAYAHKVDEQIPIANLHTAYDTLARFLS